jgi:hypothetical protein
MKEVKERNEHFYKHLNSLIPVMALLICYILALFLVTVERKLRKEMIFNR